MIGKRGRKEYKVPNPLLQVVNEEGRGRKRVKRKRKVKKGKPLLLLGRDVRLWRLLLALCVLLALVMLVLLGILKQRGVNTITFMLSS